MLNIGTGEMIVILVAALLLLGPERLPELARGLGKFLREFRRQTDDIRGTVEREFYRMDQEITALPSSTNPAAADAAQASADAPAPALGVPDGTISRAPTTPAVAPGASEGSSSSDKPHGG